ncbi:porin, partial [Enterobacter roggenkampii]
MKKSTLALMVMGVVASASVHAAEVYNKDGNKLDVYGKVKAMHYISDDATKDGDQTYVRFGFKGETQINDQLTGYGRWESEFAGNKAESDSSQKTRLAFAGLKLKNFGSLDYGRNLGALYDVEAWTDMFPEFGGDSSAQTDNFMTKRATGLATYRNTDFFGAVDGLDMTLQYQGKNENRDAKKQNGDGFGTSLSYDFG